MKTKKRFLSILLSLVMVLGLMPGMSLTAYADVNVASVTQGGTTTEYADFATALSNWADNSTLTLLADVETSSTISVTGIKTLDLNGYGIRANGTNLRVITIDNSANLTIDDSNPSAVHGYVIPSATGNGAGLATVHSVKQDGDIEFIGGYITGGNYRGNGGSIYVAGTLNKTGGTIIGNNCTGTGGGIYVEGGGKFCMTGGALVGNTAQYGGGVVIDGAGLFFTLSGSPTIRGNTAGEGTESHPVVDNNVFSTNRGKGAL